MSGFLPDLASWALGGGAGQGEDNDATEGTAAVSTDGDAQQQAHAQAQAQAQQSSQQPLTEQEVRARRLARMEALAAKQQEAPQAMEVDAPPEAGVGAKAKATSTSTSTSNSNSNSNSSMEISSPPRKKSTATGSSTAPLKQTAAGVSSSSDPKKKKAKESHSSTTSTSTSSTPTPMPTPMDPAFKLQRKKEQLLKKVVLLTLSNSTSSLSAVSTSNSFSTNSEGCVALELDDPTELGIQSVAELLATRLSLPVNELPSSSKPLVVYLATSHRRASDELQTLRRGNGAKEGDDDLVALLQEIQRQVVSYTSSALQEPDLFEQGASGVEQLTKALITAAASPDVTQSMTFGGASSFYGLLCDELQSQDAAAFTQVIRQVVTNLLEPLRQCESLDSGVGETSALGLVTALTQVCSSKKAAAVVSQLDDLMLLPKPGTPQAAESIRPPTPQGADLLRLLTGGDHRPYLKRSGPALEKQTLLGLCLRVSTPKSNPAFLPSNILRQSLDSVERTTNQQRQQLQVYQTACHQLIMALIKGGPDARTKVLEWFTDAMVVNGGATAMRPDTTKVASSALLLNVSVALLKLCDPFVQDPKKYALIDPTFVSASTAGQQLFPTTGDDAISRLGESNDTCSSMDTSETYAPKNTFVPHVFFLAARSLALGIVPGLASHENLLRHISHQHWELSRDNSRDLYSDPHFCMLVSRQRSAEVALFQEDMMTDTLRLVNLMGHVLVTLPDDQLAQLPELFVQNTCDILMSVAKLKAKLFGGMELRNVFQMVVKLLSPTYASMVRNYNLRATLGDVLHEIFLPSTGNNRRDVPSSVACDPRAGGQTYLLSDPSAQETLAPSLLLLYGEVEHTGYYDKMSHRAKISSLLKYLWESSEHRPAFRAITQNKASFIKFANGIINETNTLIATVMQKLPEIRAAQEQMANTQEWGRLSEEEQSSVTSRLEENEREVKHALPLCNKTLQMFGYLNTDADIRSLFLLGELCPRLVNMLLHVVGKLVGSKGLDLKVNNPEQYEFRPKEMLRDLCAIFALFASSNEFQVECAKSGCDPTLLRSAIKTCQRLNLLTGESMTAFSSLPDSVDTASRAVAEEEALLTDAPEEFLDEIMSTFMMDPIKLPSGHFVDRSTITQHLLNDPIDPFNREEMTLDDVKSATELKVRIDTWLGEKRAARQAALGSSSSS